MVVHPDDTPLTLWAMMDTRRFDSLAYFAGFREFALNKFDFNLVQLGHCIDIYSFFALCFGKDDVALLGIGLLVSWLLICQFLLMLLGNVGPTLFSVQSLIIFDFFWPNFTPAHTTRLAFFLRVIVIALSLHKGSELVTWLNRLRHHVFFLLGTR